MASVAVAVGGGGGRRQIVGRDPPRVPVCPVDPVLLHMQIHGVNAHVSIALEDLLVAPVWHGRVQAAYLTVVSDVEHLSGSWGCAETDQQIIVARST